MFELLNKAKDLWAWNKYVVVLVLVLVIVVIWNIATMNINDYDHYLYGLWVGDDEFCEDAEIDSMLLFIGDPENSMTSTSRNAYIVIQADGEVASNQGLVIKYSKGWAGPNLGKYTVTADVDFDDEQLWSDDGRVKITVDMRTGVMRVWAGEQLYAKLYKSMELSNVMTSDMLEDVYDEED